MNKILLSTVILSILVFLSPKAYAQSDAECFKEYQKREYKCLQEFNKCIYSCNDINTFKSCESACSSQDKICSGQASTGLTACKEAIPKDKEEIPSEAKSGQDCRKIFDRELYKCLTDANACRDACQKETKKPDGSAYFNSGEIYSKCIKERDCDGKDSACGDQAQANFWACGKSDQKPQEAKKETSEQNKKGVNVFKIFELFQEAVLNLDKNTDSGEVWTKIKFWEKPAIKEQAPPFEIPKQERKPSIQEINEWIMENDLKSDPVRLEELERAELDSKLYGRTPQMTEDIIKQYQEEWKKMYEGAETKPKETPIRVRVDYIKGDAVYKLPGSNEWVNLRMGDILPKGATLFTGMDSTVLLSMPDKGVFQMLSFTETVISEQDIKGNSFTDIQLRTGEIEVSVEKGVFTAGFQVSTPASTTGTRGTHFWVYYDKNKEVAVTGVYEGEVEVKAKGSNKTALVAPNGSKPGIAVVSQKLSPVKIALAGLVIVVILGSVIWIIKKKVLVKSSKKR